MSAQHFFPQGIHLKFEKQKVYKQLQKETQTKTNIACSTGQTFFHKYVTEY